MPGAVGDYFPTASAKKMDGQDLAQQILPAMSATHSGTVCTPFTPQLCDHFYFFRTLVTCTDSLSTVLYSFVALSIINAPRATGELRFG